MGAFDGYWGGYGGGSFIPQVQYRYFSNQSSFEFFEGFEMPELKVLLAEAESANEDTVWVPSKYKGRGHTGLSVWYVRALINEYDV